MPLVTTVMAGPMRHYFFEIAPGNTVAFFEIPGATTFHKGAGSAAPFPTQLDHIAFNLADEQALKTLAIRLEAAGSQVTEVIDHGFVKSIYFTDNNGIALEASCWIIDATGRPFDPRDNTRFRDPNPVPAIAELASGGLQTLPATTLV